MLADLATAALDNDKERGAGCISERNCGKDLPESVQLFWAFAESTENKQPNRSNCLYLIKYKSGQASKRLSAFVFFLFQLSFHECADGLTLHDAQEVAVFVDVENNDRQIVFLTKRESRHIHHTQPHADDFGKGDVIEFRC